MSERDLNAMYRDMLDMPHFEPQHHPRMDENSRAAQFAPFAALTGYHAAIDETARLTEPAPDGSEDSIEQLDRMLIQLAGRVKEHPQVTVSRFVPDETKQGGRYETVSGRLRKIDRLIGALILEDGQSVPFSHILAIEGGTQAENGESI